MQAHPGFYGRLARAVMRNRGITSLALLFVSAVALFFALQVRVDSDLLKLMPQDERSTQALARLDAEEGGINFLTIAVDAENVEERDAFMSTLAAQLEAMPETDYVLYQLDPDITYRIGLLQLPMEDLVLLRDRLKAALSLGPALANPFIAARLFDLGPMTEHLSKASEGLRLSSTEGVARMIVRPTGSAHDLPFARRYMESVDEKMEALQQEHRTVKVLWKGGAYRHNVEDYEGIVSDIGWITAASFVMVLIIIAAAFRAPRAVALIFFPLILSNLWTLGLAGATVGALNTFTSFVNAVLIGLGVEFGVHLYARYREYRLAGLGVEDAAVAAWDRVGGACTSACLTAGAGFAALIVAHFAGFKQLGVLLSAGLVLTLIAEIVCMPLLLTFMEPKALSHPAHKHHHRRRRRLPSFYRLAPVSLLVIGTITVVTAFLAPKIKFEYDLSELRRAGLAYADLDPKEQALARDSYSPLVVSYGSEAEMNAAYEAIKKRVDDKRFPEIARVISVRTVLPADQPQRVALLQEIVAQLDDPAATYLPVQVKTNLARLKQSNPREMTVADLPGPLQHMLGAANGQHRILLFPAGNMWDMREAAALSSAVERELKGATVAGEYLSLGVLYRLMRQDAPIIAAIAGLLVLFFTWLDLRTWKATLGAMAIQLAGIAWWGALLVLSDIRLSIVNFVGIPIVAGIGIDVMIHLIHRMKQEGPGRLVKALSTTGWASALGTSTTVVAFAALSLASSQGIRSLGLLVLLGEMAVTLAGFLLVPLGFATWWHLNRQHPKEDEDTSEVAKG